VGTFGPNTLGTYHLLRLAERAGARALLFFSSSEVYGQVDDDGLALREDTVGRVDPTALRSCYAESKRAGETLCVCFHSQHGVPVRIVRPFHTYGPGMRLDDGRVFADFVSDVVHNRDIVLRSAGDARRTFCYAADATAGFFTVLLKGEPGQAYNVGNPDAEVSVLQLAETLVGLFPDKHLSVVRRQRPARDGYIPSAVGRNLPDITKVRALGWRPRTDIEEGFSRTVRSFG